MARTFMLQGPNENRWLWCSFIDYEGFPKKFSGHVINGGYPLKFVDGEVFIAGKGHKGYKPVWSGRVPEKFRGSTEDVILNFFESGEYLNYPETEVVEAPGKMIQV